MSRFTLSLASALLLICGVALSAQETRPAGAPAEQDLRDILHPERLRQPWTWTVDRSLANLLAEPANDPTSRLSGRFIMDFDLADARAGAPSTQPANLHGYVTVDLRPTIAGNLNTQIQTTLAATTQPFEVALEQARLDQMTVDRLDQDTRLLILLKQAGAGEQNTAYLGIGVEPPGEALRSQLSLPDGAGLVVNYVADEGPSKDVIHMHDVLQKLDDQILVNGEQLVTLVRMHKPGEAITLTLLRQASPRSERITLGHRPPESKEAQPAGPQGSSAPQGSNGQEWLSEVPYLGRLYRTDIDSRPITFNDGEFLASFNSHGDLLVIDQKTGKTLFNGPIGSKEQWEQAPEAVRNKLNAWRAMIAVYQPAQKH